MSAIIILGSARSDGNTRQVCDFLFQAKQTPILDLNEFQLAYYSYSHDHEDDFFSIMEKALAYDTLIFATPVYWYSMSAQLKTFLDRFTDLLKVRKDLGRRLRGKNMKVICCSSNDEEYPEFWSPFIRSAEYLGMHYQGHVHTWIEANEIPTIVKNRLMQGFEWGKKLFCASQRWTTYHEKNQKASEVANEFVLKIL